MHYTHFILYINVYSKSLSLQIPEEPYFFRGYGGISLVSYKSHVSEQKTVWARAPKSCLSCCYKGEKILLDFCSEQRCQQNAILLAAKVHKSLYGKFIYSCIGRSIFAIKFCVKFPLKAECFSYIIFGHAKGAVSKIDRFS